MPNIQSNGVNLYFELHGPDDAEVMVLSNGIFMSTASWINQLTVLKEHFRVLLYDCRGMWQSDHPVGPYSMEQHADDLAGLLNALGISKAHIGGISYGGEISMMFALKYPEMVKSLIISAAVSQIDPLLKAIATSWKTAASSGDGGLLFDVTLPFNFSEGWISANSSLLSASKKRFGDMDLKAAVELMSAFEKVNYTSELHKIKSPCVILVGELDIIKPRKYSEIIAREISGAELVIIPDSGHAVCIEQPAIFNTIITGFLTKQMKRID